MRNLSCIKWRILHKWFMDLAMLWNLRSRTHNIYLHKKIGIVYISYGENMSPSTFHDETFMQLAVFKCLLFRSNYLHKITQCIWRLHKGLHAPPPKAIYRDHLSRPLKMRPFSIGWTYNPTQKIKLQFKGKTYALIFLFPDLPLGLNQEDYMIP